MLRFGIGAGSRAALGMTVLVVADPALAAAPVGDATSVVQQVTGELDGRRRPVRAGEKVFQDETIRTERGSEARLLLLDRSNLWIGSLAAVKLDRFVYDPGGRGSSVAVSALKGALRWASGALPSRSYTITTPHVALGIRGTTFDVLVARNETIVVLIEGAVTVCPRGRRGPCQALTQPGTVSIGNAAGVQGPGSPRVRTLDIPALYQRLGAANLIGAVLPSRVGELPGLPGVRIDAGRRLPAPQLPAGAGGILGGEGNSLGGSLSVGPGGISIGGGPVGTPGTILGRSPAPSSPGSSPGVAVPALPTAPSLPALPSAPSLPQLPR
jgi:hypothetical protein